MEKKIQLPDEEFDKIVYRLCSFLNDHNFFEISQHLLQLITNKTSITYQLELAKITLFFKDYDKAIEISNDIVSKDKKNHNAWIIRGHAFYFKKNLFDSEESYVKAIRCSTQFDPQMLFRLGMTYVNRKTWDDAKVVFLKLLKENYSFAWRYLGLSYMRLGQFEHAEESLNEANLLDVENVSIWGYLTIFCLLCGRKNQGFECVKEVMKSSSLDLSILEEIGDLFYTKYGI
jgi:tetratricopeptide (TPR) repeat protein